MSNEKKVKEAELTQNVNTLDPIARRHARQYALQAMYQWQLAGGDLLEIENEFLANHINKKNDLLYFKLLIHGIPKQLDALDSEIKSFLNRAFGEIDPIELAILRLATFELRECPDVPYRVIINEALELTKKFGSIEGYKFVNGILDKIAKKIRATEIKMANEKKQ